MLKPALHLDSFGISDIGLVRDHNEDSWAVYPEESLFILADGMGGHSAGEIAAKEAVAALHSLVKKWRPSADISLAEAKKFFSEAFVKVNALVHDAGENNEQLKGMGTTLCSLFFLREFAILAHVGDSRIYLLRDNKLEQLTEDHSLVAELIALGSCEAR